MVREKNPLSRRGKRSGNPNREIHALFVIPFPEVQVGILPAYGGYRYLQPVVRVATGSMSSSSGDVT
jgi:hypothetical protein